MDIISTITYPGGFIMHNKDKKYVITEPINDTRYKFLVYKVCERRISSEIFNWGEGGGEGGRCLQRSLVLFYQQRAIEARPGEVSGAWMKPIPPNHLSLRDCLRWKEEREQQTCSIRLRIPFRTDKLARSALECYKFQWQKVNKTPQLNW
jgi:hypothetical protein